MPLKINLQMLWNVLYSSPTNDRPIFKNSLPVKHIEFLKEIFDDNFKISGVLDSRPRLSKFMNMNGVNTERAITGQIVNDILTRTDKTLLLINKCKELINRYGIDNEIFDATLIKFSTLNLELTETRIFQYAVRISVESKAHALACLLLMGLLGERVNEVSDQIIEKLSIDHQNPGDHATIGKRVTDENANLKRIFSMEYSDLLPNNKRIQDAINRALSLGFVFKEAKKTLDGTMHTVNFRDTTFKVPYKELFGVGKNDLYNADYKHFRFRHEDNKVDFSCKINDFKEQFQSEVAGSVAAGYGEKSLVKLKIDSISRKFENDNAFVEMSFSGIDYFSHRIVRNWYLNSINSDAYFKSIKELKIDGLGNETSLNFSDLDWPMCGCGIWIVTKDNMLLMSRRTRVTEEPGKLGYSAAGSCDKYYYDNEGNQVQNMYANPFLIIHLETLKEIGIPRKFVKLDDIRILSAGIDTPRCLMQFSFFLKIDMNAEDVLLYALEAPSRAEQDLFAIPLAKDPLVFILTHYDLEPGAVVSLENLISRIK